jgi:hypothetical protein
LPNELKNVSVITGDAVAGVLGWGSCQPAGKKGLIETGGKNEGQTVE